MVDDIERAISHLPEELAQNAWAQNVVKMSKNLDKNLSKIGVEKLIPLKELFLILNFTKQFNLMKTLKVKKRLF